MKWFRQTQAPALMKWIKIKPIFSDTIEMDWVSLGVMKPQMCITLEKKMLSKIVFGCQLSAAGAGVLRAVSVHCLAQHYCQLRQGTGQVTLI